MARKRHRFTVIVRRTLVRFLRVKVLADSQKDAACKGIDAARNCPLRAGRAAPQTDYFVEQVTQ